MVWWQFVGMKAHWSACAVACCLTYIASRLQAYDLLKSYDPWGKPGCGAPNPIAIRRHNLLVDGLFPEIKFKRSQFPESAILEKRRNRSAIRPRHRDSTLYYHPNNKAHVDNMLRWKTPVDEQIKYRKCLDDIINYKKKMEDEEGKTKAEYEKKMLHSHGPWGAKGPGGRPWRHPGNVGRDFFDSMGWTTESSFKFPPINKYSPKTRFSPRTGQRPSNVDKLQAIENIPRKNFETRSSDCIKDPTTEVAQENRLASSSKSYLVKSNKCRIKGCNCDVPIKPYRVPSGEERGGGTPNSQLLQMTGGVELVPLIRGRRKPRVFSGNKKWRARDSEYLKVLTEQVRMQQNRKKDY